MLHCPALVLLIMLLRVPVSLDSPVSLDCLVFLDSPDSGSAIWNFKKVLPSEKISLINRYLLLTLLYYPVPCIYPVGLGIVDRIIIRLGSSAWTN